MSVRTTFPLDLPQLNFAPGTGHKPNRGSSIYGARDTTLDAGCADSDHLVAGDVQSQLMGRCALNNSVCTSGTEASEARGGEAQLVVADPIRSGSSRHVA